MCAKIIILLATLCAVHSSMVGVRSLDDESNTLVEQQLEATQIRACELFCTSFGFSDGVLFNGGCACNPLEDMPDYSLNEENISRTRCKVRKCIRYCRKVGQTGGNCSSGSCACDPPNGDE